MFVLSFKLYLFFHIVIGFFLSYLPDVLTRVSKFPLLAFSVFRRFKC